MIETNPTGVLFESKKNSDANKLKIAIKKKERLLYQEADFDFDILRPKDGWFESNEPEEHLDEISKDIKREIIDDKSQQILCFSYKDTSLAHRIEKLTRKKASTMYLISEKNNTIFHGYPEDYSEQDFCGMTNPFKNMDVIICRHYLEHFHEKSNVLRGLSNYLQADGLIYIEVPDCQEFINKENPLFLWEQHRIYFTDASLKDHIEENGFEIIWIKKLGDNIEPSICALIKKKSNNSKKQNNIFQSERCDSIDYTDNIKEMIKKYRYKWISRLSQQERSIVMLGVGHNTDRFLQYTNTYKYIDHIVDGNTQKQGLYILNYDKKIESDKILKNIRAPIVISGCHDRAFGGLKRKLKMLNPEAEILNIFGDI